MRRGLAVLILLFTPTVLPAGAASADPIQVVRIDVRGKIDAATRHAVRSRFETAGRRKADLIVLVLDSTGGRIDFALDLGRVIEHASLPVVSCIRGRAGPLAALLTLSSDRIYFREGAWIGSGRSTIRPGRRLVSRQRFTDRLKSHFIRTASNQGYSVPLAAALVDPALEIKWVKGPNGERSLMTAGQFDRASAGHETLETVCGAGELLRIEAGDAFRFGLSSGVVKHVAQVVETEVQRAGAVRYNLLPLPASGVERILQLLSRPLVFGFLIVVAVVAALLELKRPGSGTWGSLFVCLTAGLLFTFSILDVAGAVSVTLFMVGISLYALELLLPGRNVSAGVAGVLLVLCSLALAVQGFVVPRVRAEPWALEYALDSLALVLVSGATGLFLYLLISRCLPDSYFDVTAVCPGPLEEETGDHEQNSVGIPREGMEGWVDASLRPVGVLRIEDHPMVAFAENRYVREGIRFEVIDVNEARVTIRPQ